MEFLGHPLTQHGSMANSTVRCSGAICYCALSLTSWFLMRNSQEEMKVIPLQERWKQRREGKGNPCKE